MNMQPLAIVAAIVGIIGTVYAVLVGLRRKSLARPKFEIHLGLIGHRLVPREHRKSKFRTLIFGIDVKKVKHPLIFCPYRLTNSGKIPIREISLRIEYPRNILVDNSVFIDNEAQVAIFVKSPEIPDRKVTEIGDTAQVSYDLPLLRPGETIVIPDIMRAVPAELPKQNVTSSVSQNSSALAKRCSRVDGFLEAALIQASVWSSDLDPVAIEGAVIAFKASTLEELELAFAKFADAIWDEKRPIPGNYLRNPFSRGLTGGWDWQPFTVELAGMYLPELGLFDMKDRYNEAIQRIVESTAELAYFHLPPWGFYGPSFDLREHLTLIKKSKKASQGL